jgi:hypothetical protein
MRLKPFEVTYSFYNNKAHNHRPTKMELEVRTTTVWAVSLENARHIAKKRLGEASIKNITPKWS